METLHPLIMLLIAANAVATYQGFKSTEHFRKYAFEVDPILMGREYERLFTSGFLHVNWMHWSFNMLTLYFFSDTLTLILGIGGFLAVYFGSLLAGNLLALYVHKEHGDYRAVGASGAVSGVVFASLILFPESEIGFIFIPIAIPGWLYGIVFILGSIYGIKSQLGNIGHDAHLGGAVAGMLITMIMQPKVLQLHPFIIAAFLLPALAFLYLIITKPEALLIDNYVNYQKQQFQAKKKENKSTKKQQVTLEKVQEMDRLLDKINQEGYDALSPVEKDRLKYISKEMGD